MSSKSWVLPAFGDDLMNKVMSSHQNFKDDIDTIKKQAYEEGLKQGLDKGFEEGLKNAQEQISNWQVAFDDFMMTFCQPLKRQEEDISNALSDLAMTITRHIIRREMKQEPEQVIAVVREVLKQLPIGHQSATLHLHPDDAQLVRDVFSIKSDEPRSWQVVDDPSISRGGCRLLSEYSNIDATVEKRVALAFAHVFGDEREAQESAPE